MYMELHFLFNFIHCHNFFPILGGGGFFSVVGKLKEVMRKSVSRKCWPFRTAASSNNWSLNRVATVKQFQRGTLSSPCQLSHRTRNDQNENLEIKNMKRQIKQKSRGWIVIARESSPVHILTYITHLPIDKSIGELDWAVITSLSRFDTDVNEMQIKLRLGSPPTTTPLHHPLLAPSFIFKWQWLRGGGGTTCNAFLIDIFPCWFQIERTRYKDEINRPVTST